jgi:hypothetical protein
MVYLVNISSLTVFDLVRVKEKKAKKLISLHLAPHTMSLAVSVSFLAISLSASLG